MRPTLARFLPFALLWLALPLQAAPTALAVQGGLRTALGGPVADGNYAMAVSLYVGEVDKVALFQEKFLAVAVAGGGFALELGTGDAQKPLDDALFTSGQAQWVGVQVGGDPELTRIRLRPVPYAMHASLADNLACSGCVTGTALAANTVSSKHVDFGYAASSSKGGPADSALVALQAKAADFATSADEAKSAVTAKSADIAKDLQCTGCVAASEVDATFAADLAKAGQLAPVALSGAYKDLTGGPDLTPYALLGKANTFAQTQTFGADVDFAKHQALNLRLQNSATEPAPCDATTVGLLYYNTVTAALMLCNGKTFTAFAFAIPLGSDAKAPGASCQQILDKTGVKKSGTFWLDPNGGSTADAFQGYCDMVTDGGGWTRVMAAKYNFFFGDATWAAYNADKPLDNNYSILGLRDSFKQGATYTWRLASGNGDWQTGVAAHTTVWQQNHDAFTATSNGSDYKFISGDSSSTCGGFNGLHNKYTGFSYTSDPDATDGDGCWWMQVVPKKDYDGKGYLEGYGGPGHYHQWQVLWLR